MTVCQKRLSQAAQRSPKQACARHMCTSEHTPAWSYVCRTGAWWSCPCVRTNRSFPWVTWTPICVAGHQHDCKGFRCHPRRLQTTGMPGHASKRSSGHQHAVAVLKAQSGEQGGKLKSLPARGLTECKPEKGKGRNPNSSNLQAQASAGAEIALVRITGMTARQDRARVRETPGCPTPSVLHTEQHRRQLQMLGTFRQPAIMQLAHS